MCYIVSHQHKQVPGLQYTYHAPGSSFAPGFDEYPSSPGVQPTWGQGKPGKRQVLANHLYCPNFLLLHNCRTGRQYLSVPQLGPLQHTLCIAFQMLKSQPFTWRLRCSCTRHRGGMCFSLIPGWTRNALSLRATLASSRVTCRGT